MKRLQALLSVLLLFLAIPSNAQSVVDSLRIDVLLHDDGSAKVTEVWHIDVQGSITEWYLVKSNLGKMDISNLCVTDETGTSYSNEGTSWDIDRSRSEKAYRCGMVRKSDGYEVCWGVGSNGSHVYTVTYDLYGLVKAYTDADGFNYMFVSRGMSSAPENVLLRIRKQGTILNSDNVKIWGFGFHGEIEMLEGAIESWSTESFTENSSMIILASFGQGMFTPSLSENKSFEEVQSTAFEGSDYSDPGEETVIDKVMDFLIKIIGFIIAAAVAVGTFFNIKQKVKTNRRKQELLGGSKKEVPWYRDVPVNGNLRNAFGILQVYSEGDVKNLISAYMTRLFYRGVFEIEPQSMGKPALKINAYKQPDDPNGLMDYETEAELYGFIKAAAGDDSVLQQKELRRWAASHGEQIYNWQQNACLKQSVWSLNKEDVQAVFGLKRFLKEFTLVKDRGVVEVKLWNNYLIFASLYGIAEQVYKDFKKVCPEYFTLAQQYSQASADMTPVVMWDTINNMSWYMNSGAQDYVTRQQSSSESTRWSGGGGMTSFGGGGGFSGGGVGGGGR